MAQDKGVVEFVPEVRNEDKPAVLKDGGGKSNLLCCWVWVVETYERMNMAKLRISCFDSLTILVMSSASVVMSWTLLASMMACFCQDI